MHGSVFPVIHGPTLAVRVAQRGGWRTVERATVTPSGAYALQLPGPGSYRVVYHRVSGPAIAIS